VLSGLANPMDVIKKMFSEERWNDLVLFCKKMLQEDPHDMIALQNISATYIRMGRFSDALSCSNVVLEISPDDEYALKNKIYALEGLGRYEDVIACCDRLLGKNKSDVWALDSKGLAFNQIGRQNDAIECYDLSLKYDPNNVTALANKASTLSFLKRYEEAIACYDVAQKLNTNIRGLALAKSAAYQNLGMDDEAFLAAQGLLGDDIVRFKEEARRRKMKVFDWYCLSEFNELEEKEKKHQEKMNSKLG
jgi:tetratricopeptide (TPR) repeat protein